MSAPILRLAVGLLGTAGASAAGAATATSLESFEGIEEPLVRYEPSTGAFCRDSFVNIAELGDGAFRMTVRYRSDEWDADRDTQNKDRQRAEVKGLGRHQKTGETFDYTTTWRTNPGFRAPGRFCHILQLKSTDGDSGAPVVTISIAADGERAEVRYWSGTAKSAAVAREFPWKPGEWQTVCVRVRISTDDDGEVLASVDGDAFQGARGVAVFRPGASDYRPKWGLYRGAGPGLAMGDDFVEHRRITAGETGTIEPLDPGMEKTARELERDSPAKALSWLLSQPPSHNRAQSIATIAADWAAREPAAAMKWLEDRAPGDRGEQAVLHVFNRWADRDVDAVIEWASARAPAPWLDTLLWYFATDTTVRYTARGKALAGAVLIGDPELRGDAIGHVVLIWARSEPDAATRYVEECAALSASQRAALANEIAVRGR